MSSNLDALFSKEPLSLTDADLDVIIAHSRELRSKFIKAESAGGKGSEAVAINLDDLDLKL